MLAVRIIPQRANLIARCLLFFSVVFLAATSSVWANGSECHLYYSSQKISEIPGYRQEIKELDPKEPHTISSMETRIISDLGEDGYKAAKESDVPFLIFQGPLQEAIVQARKAGYSQFDVVQKARRVIEVIKAIGPDGKKVIIIARVNGEDSLLHAQSVLRLAGVKETRVFTFGQEIPLKKYYSHAFKKIGYVPDGLIFGWPNSLVNVIFSKNMVSNSIRYLSLANAYRKKHATPHFNDHELDGVSVQVIEFKNGKKIWFVNYARGDRSKDIFEAAIDHGIKDITFVGTCGGLCPQNQVGDIVTPSHEMKEDGTIVDIRPLVAPLPEIGTSGLYQRVSTPNIETERWLKKAKKDNVRYIDVELGYLFDIKRKNPDVKITPLMVVSDILDTDHRSDITKWSAAKARQYAPGLLKLFKSKFNMVKDEDFKIKSYFETPLYDKKIEKDLLENDVEIIWFLRPKVRQHISFVAGSTSLGEGDRFWNLRGNRLKTTVPTIQKEMSKGRDITGPFVRFRIRVNEAEADHIREIVKSRLGTKPGKLETCTAAVCSVIFDATDFKVPFPFSHVPHLNGVYLYLLDLFGHERIVGFEYVNPKSQKLTENVKTK